jgi:hypothetical protein
VCAALRFGVRVGVTAIAAVATVIVGTTPTDLGPRHR